MNGWRSVTAQAAAALGRRQTTQRAEQLIAARWTQTPYVFTSAAGTPLLASNISHRFKAELARAGLPPMRFHDLRHATATPLAGLGVPARTTMEILGHSQISLTLNTYTHVSDESATEAIRRLEQALARA